MRAWKIAAVAVGVIVAWFVVNAVIGLVISALIGAAVLAVIGGAIYVGIKMAKSKRQVSRGHHDYEVPDTRSRSLPRTDVDRVSRPVPPSPASGASAADVDDELARLKREMGS